MIQFQSCYGSVSCICSDAIVTLRCSERSSTTRKRHAKKKRVHKDEFGSLHCDRCVHEFESPLEVWFSPKYLQHRTRSAQQNSTDRPYLKSAQVLGYCRECMMRYLSFLISTSNEKLHLPNTWGYRSCVGTHGLFKVAAAM